MPNKSHILSDTGKPAYVQHWTDPRCVFPWNAAQILPVELPSPWCLLFCVMNRIIYLLPTGWSVVTVISTEFLMQHITVNKFFRQLKESLCFQFLVLMGKSTTPISAGRTTKRGTRSPGGC